MNLNLMSTEPFSYVNNNNSGYILENCFYIKYDRKINSSHCLDHKLLETLTMSVISLYLYIFSLMIRGDHSSNPSIPPQTDLPPDFYNQSIDPVYGNMCVLKQSDLCFSHRYTQCCCISYF